MRLMTHTPIVQYPSTTQRVGAFSGAATNTLTSEHSVLQQKAEAILKRAFENAKYRLSKATVPCSFEEAWAHMRRVYETCQNFKKGEIDAQTIIDKTFSLVGTMLYPPAPPK